MLFNKKNKNEPIENEPIEIEESIEERALRLYPVKMNEVYGYKAVDKNLKSFNGDYQYCIDKPNIFEGELEYCKSGLHFCPELIDLYQYCDIYKSRIFKIKAIIDINLEHRAEYINQEKHKGYMFYYNEDFQSKKVGNKITFLEELSDIDIYNSFKDHFSYFERNVFSSFEEFKKYRFCEDIITTKLNSMKDELINAGYSKLFSEVFIDYKIDKSNSSSNSIDFEAYKYALAYMKEGLSKEMAVYLLMK